MNTNPRIEPIQEQEIPELLDLKWDVFHQHFVNRTACDSYTLGAADWKLSVKLTCEGRTIGMYLLKEGTVLEVLPQEHFTTLYESLERYRGKRGIQGVTLALHKAYRGHGWGNLLKEYPRTLAYDYWWGLALKTLGNLRDWQKRARLVAENQELYLILEDYGPRITGTR